MNAPHVSDYESVLDRVRGWPAADRFALIQEVLQTIAPAPNGAAQPAATEHATASTPPDKKSQRTPWVDTPEKAALREQIRNALANPKPPPTDEERRAAFDRLEGILATDKPPPPDQEVKQWLEEEWWLPTPNDDERTAALKKLRGIAARPDRPPPTDEEIERWKEDWRMEKFG